VGSSFLTAFKQFGDNFIDGEALSDSGTFRGSYWSESFAFNFS